MQLAERQSEIQRLRDENDELREELRQIRDDIKGWSPLFPIEWKLSQSETVILSALQASRGVFRTAESLLVALHGLDHDHHPYLIKAFIYRMRKKLRPHGVTVESVWGEGYRLSSISKETVNKSWISPIIHHTASNLPPDENAMTGAV